jgi:hypothetical protein
MFSAVLSFKNYVLLFYLLNILYDLVFLFLIVYNKLLQRPIRASFNEFAGTPIDAPLDGLHEKFERCSMGEWHM